MNPPTITRHLITALVMAIAILWLWPTIAHAQSSTTIRGAGLQPLVEESGSTQTLNIYGPGGVIIAQVATDSPAGGTPTTQTRYLLHDHLGSTRVVLDSNNQVLGSFDYSPFGETTVSNGATGNVADVAYRYTGQEVNGALGTYNYHARHYDAGVGRFLGVDPARYNASPYLYANDNPINFVDQNGQRPLVWFVSSLIINNGLLLETLNELTGLSSKFYVPRGGLGILEYERYIGQAPQTDFSLFIRTHGDSDGFQVQFANAIGISNAKAKGITPEAFTELVYRRFVQEDLQPERLKSIFLEACNAGCEQNGISPAERFFQQGIERFPNLERLIASPYELTIYAHNGQLTLEFISTSSGAPNQAIALSTSYDPHQFFNQEINEATLRANIQGLKYLRRGADNEWFDAEDVPRESYAYEAILSHRFSQPLLRTYTRSQVEQRNTLRELPFFSEGLLP